VAGLMIQMPADNFIQKIEFIPASSMLTYKTTSPLLADVMWMIASVGSNWAFFP
jgi:hypothetical protein